MIDTTLRATPRDAPRSNVLFNQILREFRAMPGLSLTLAQASQRFDLPEATCLRLLIRLTDADALCLRHDGRYELMMQPA